MNLAEAPVSPFDYPQEAHARRHGPGYKDAASYRPWLEDEFLFRCVYCLGRKVWSAMAPLEVEHVAPQSTGKEEPQHYDNLVLSCRRCNGLKHTLRLPDPCKVAFGACLRVEPDGAVTALNRDGERLVKHLKLNEREHVEWRRKFMDLVELAFRSDPSSYESFFGFPSELPDLTLLKPPLGNTRPDGVAQSCHARRLRGELPRVY